MTQIHESMLINEILELDDGITKVFEKNGLMCLGCPGAAGETLAEAAAGHSIDLDKLIADVNHYLENK